MFEKKVIAISACLLGEKCRYDASDNKNTSLLKKLQGHELIAFCPEDHAFGSPRATMDLVETNTGIKALCSLTQDELSAPILAYAKSFFTKNKHIDLFIGKDRSPSCGVCSAKVYTKEHKLITASYTGLMAQEALNNNIKSIDAEAFKGIE